ncbi:hypothetical protein AC630_39235 [Bradyrhizobium sp. AS23.2]|nr:hypothetical protein AC630_39235 [Bradyrhizobium sp. AS23.2]
MIPAEASRPVSALIFSRMSRAISLAKRDALKVFGHIEVSFVERQGFDDGCVLGEDIADLPTDGFVDFEARLNEDQVRTLTLCSDRWHR